MGGREAEEFCRKRSVSPRSRIGERTPATSRRCERSMIPRRGAPMESAQLVGGIAAGHVGARTAKVVVDRTRRWWRMRRRRGRRRPTGTAGTARTHRRCWHSWSNRWRSVFCSGGFVRRCSRRPTVRSVRTSTTRSPTAGESAKPVIQGSAEAAAWAPEFGFLAGPAGCAGPASVYNHYPRVGVQISWGELILVDGASNQETTSSAIVSSS